ncbi:hypothetical protein RCL1_007489 [Eukaryota sp. TZLM3-RCL]
MFVQLIVEETLPLNLVESKKNFKLVCRKTLSKRISETYERIFQQVKYTLSSESVSFTTDICTSINATPFISLTAHYITDEFTMMSVVIDCRPFGHPHNTARISYILQIMLNEIEVAQEVAFTTDNAANMLSAIDLTNGVRAIMGEPSLLGTRCYGHILNLVAQSGINDFDHILQKIRDLAEKLAHSSFLTQELRDCFVEVHHHSLKRDVATRWNSTITMIKNYLVKIDVINLFFVTCEAENLVTLRVLPNEVTQLRDVVELLELFEEATRIASSASKPTISMCVLMFSLIEKKLKDLKKKPRQKT